MKLLIIDGHNLLFQMFFGMPSRITGKDGRQIHGTLGFTGALIKMIKLVGPTHAAALFDGERENPRTALSEEYKANRIGYANIPHEENPFSQLADIYAALESMGVAHAEVTDGEADDAIAACALTYNTIARVVIASFDSDFFQLINENVFVLRYRGDKTILCDSAFINNKFGITPSIYADFKALTGDASDNIKGAEHIGPKRAAMLLNQFGSLRGILNNANEIEKPLIRNSIITNAERLLTNYALIKLDGKVKIPFDLKSLEYAYNGVSTNEVLRRIGVM